MVLFACNTHQTFHLTHLSETLGKAPWELPPLRTPDCGPAFFRISLCVRYWRLCIYRGEHGQGTILWLALGQPHRPTRLKLVLTHADPRFLSPMSVPDNFLVRKDSSTLLRRGSYSPAPQGLQTVPFSATSHRRRKDWYI